MPCHYMVMLFILYGSFKCYLSSNFILGEVQEDDLDEIALYMNVNTTRSKMRKHLTVPDNSFFPNKEYFTNKIQKLIE